MHRSIVRADGTIQLGAAAERAGYRPGVVVEIIVASSGSLIIALDQSPPALDVNFRPGLYAGTVAEARALGSGKRRRAG